jgi:hypothetical protein
MRESDRRIYRMRQDPRGDKKNCRWSASSNHVQLVYRISNSERPASRGAVFHIFAFRWDAMVDGKPEEEDEKRMICAEAHLHIVI